ncbi:hypothetical protein [Nonomuraea roseola]|uniref:Extradiol ring-cleavage dioxygenase class III enzyme subunit B domain-containing protein n=1 Tax=Nonomuraea roseola TaxID=46179 RepID=A0ABV5Q9S9_9ACTN
MLVAAAVCPHPPLIVPELAGAAAPELDGLRAACAAAIGAVLAVDHDLLVVVGSDERTRAYGRQAAGTLGPWGVDVRVGEGEPVLPLSLTIGRWLLTKQPTNEPTREPAGEPNAGAAGEPAGEPTIGAADEPTGEPTGGTDGEPDGTAAGGRGLVFQGVASDASVAECLALGAKLVEGRRTALLVMGDGSACLTEKSPGYLHPAAAPYNEEIVRALAEADTGALAAMDPAQAAALWVAGRAALQVLAGAAEGTALRPALLDESSPYGVGYCVATWLEGRAP